MKKALLLLCIPILCSLQSQAQGRRGLWIAPVAHFGGGTMTDIYPNQMDPELSLTLGAGVEAYYMFTNNFGVGTGLEYSGYGYKWSYTENRNTLDYIGAQGALDVPIFIRMVSGNKGGFFAHLGVINSFLITSQGSLELNGVEEYKVSGSESNKDFEKVTFSPFVYFGGNIPCGNRVQMTVGPQFAYQLSSNFTNESGLDGHYITLSIKVGVGIHAYRHQPKSK